MRRYDPGYLDLKRTLWKNLINYNIHDRRLYVNQLFYRQTASKTLPKRLIVVVDQSGSMVDAMVQSAIMASIFRSRSSFMTITWSTRKCRFPSC